MGLCERLGGMTLLEMWERMTGAEMSLWIAKAELDAADQKARG
jgi:hypothetical protein